MTALYRYHGSLLEASLSLQDLTALDVRVSIDLERFTVIRETPCGYWFVPDWMASFPHETIQEEKRWVSKDAVRRHCYPTKQEAWVSFKARCRKRLQHKRRELAVARALVDATQAVPEPPTHTDGVKNGILLD